MKDVIDAVFRTIALAKLVGRAPAFASAVAQVPRIASSDAAVLLRGETGTGKELTARAIHYLSRRSTGPFVAINCGAFPEALIEGELFGHAAGAFTDARSARKGLVAEAEGGTLFLDEVDALPVRRQ